MSGQFTGRHMAAILISFFAIVIAVNVVNAVYASRTFGGLVVENSYVASQKFNGWLKEARQEKALGWDIALRRSASGRIDASISSGGRLLPGAHVSAVVRHPLGRVPDRSIGFHNVAAGEFESDAALPAGRWIVHLSVEAHGHTVQRIVDLG
jgi:nitrogen fixation protein FixH